MSRRPSHRTARRRNWCSKANVCCRIPCPQAARRNGVVAGHGAGVVQLVEDAGVGPALQPPPAGHPGAEPEFLRQVLPTDPGVHHEQDALQALPVRHRPRTRRLVRPRRQQRLDQLPKLVIESRCVAEWCRRYSDPPQPASLPRSTTLFAGGAARPVNVAPKSLNASSAPSLLVS